ncbi:glycerophosphodiester phosphodiesterase domain-containing protein 4 isoform X1 [Chelonoidis abingdonii]|uniref:glycerophosphodiester phosphodiesterase domain-containing protein 4 isoform X1 n=1 Tax=Chelonoidis abingdonii TaxID=106734 RepID=UPI0013F1B0B5|nr:glycerophosphodiester phosphodiesterase domain-containing protein 4 isoform X1 [Chelonoidis abingdonii]XP_032627419.1 glycerophosphodiester phosphodiesterase domain-containing protein 4 isoform X1 [Chelonoidis abingdonii]XP_032627420.1 glycerophosphodiester phosphodiesterase domain-containing protein 4 isoform X1 [Chelonoidis abingdonii]
MDSGSVSLKKLKFGKWKVVRRHLLQRYEHQPFISCLAGLYSCRWKRYQRRRTEPGQCCCKMWECVFFPFLVGAFCLSLVFLYMWGEAKNDYNNFDWYNYGNIGHWFLWSVLLLILAAVLFTYITLLLVLAVCLLSESQQLYLHWSHKIGTFLVLGFSIAAISVFSKLWRVRWKTVLLSFQVTAPYLHIGAIAAMVLLSWPVALHAFRTNKKVIQAIIIGPYLAILVVLFLIPLGMYSPCIREMGTLGPKPALIGHRGAPMLAPENTEMSFQKTIEHGGDGLETDVTISYDGIPFLMHDSNLQRTTNIREVFPSNSTQNAALFSWDALEQLNAGKWFLKDTPFSCMGSLSSADQKLAMNQSIYKLSHFLRLADSANKLVIFDLYRPPEKHPYRNTWINITLEVIRDSGINPHLVLWLDNTMRSFVQAVAPGFQHTMASKAPVDQLLRDNVVKLNLVYSAMSSEDIRKYAQANITTNLYVISEPWLFSLAWCVGVHSVTTNAVHFLKDINRPLFLMTPKEYRIMWLLTDVVAALLISLIFALHWWREKGFSCCSDDSGVVLENGIYNKFRTELNDLPTVVA